MNELNFFRQETNPDEIYSLPVSFSEKYTYRFSVSVVNLSVRFNLLCIKRLNLSKAIYKK